MRLLLLDDHTLFRESLASMLLLRLPGSELVTVETAQQAEAQLAADGFDGVLLDLDLGHDSGLAVLQRWRLAYPALAIVVLSASTLREHMQRALALGARGYLVKSCSCTLLVGALELVRAGGIYIPPEMLVGDGFTAEPPIPAIAATDVSTPTARQIEVLVLLAQGASNKDIARRLDVADGTVRSHINALFRSLQASNRTQLVMRAQRLGWL